MNKRREGREMGKLLQEVGRKEKETDSSSRSSRSNKGKGGRRKEGVRKWTERETEKQREERGLLSMFFANLLVEIV